jgi:Uma2 family endonuclease
MRTATRNRRDALVEELYRVEGKAEIVNGEVVKLMATGHLPSRAAFEIASRLREHERQVGHGYAYADNTGFLVNLPNRTSFSPDAAFFTGEPTGMKFLEGAPVFAVEVRSENDYGPVAERQMAQKWADYFAAGTRAVWDVDLQSDEAIVRLFRAEDGASDPAATYARGADAAAEPALAGFSMPVEALFG